MRRQRRNRRSLLHGWSDFRAWRRIVGTVRWGRGSTEVPGVGGRRRCAWLGLIRLRVRRGDCAQRKQGGSKNPCRADEDVGSRWGCHHGCFRRHASLLWQSRLIASQATGTASRLDVGLMSQCAKCIDFTMTCSPRICCDDGKSLLNRATVSMRMLLQHGEQAGRVRYLESWLIGTSTMALMVHLSDASVSP
jgi:hypothetical protein